MSSVVHLSRLSTGPWLLAAALLSGCGDATGDDGAGGAGTGGGATKSMPTTPLLGSSHPGYQHTNCAACHSLPVDYHMQTNPSDCAACHGGNGACDPTLADKEHQRSEDCQSCHGQNHGVRGNQNCVNCHFAPSGLVDCTDR